MATKKPSVPLRGPQLLWDQAGEFLPLAPEAAPAVQPQAKRNAFAYANDTAIDIANAATNLAKSGVDLFAPDSAVSARMADFVKSGEESQSDWKKAQRAKLQAELAAADGELAKAGAYIKHAVVDDPLGTVAEAAGNFAPFAVLGRGMQVARMSDAAKIAAGGTTAGALSAGEVRGNIWQRISETPDAVLQQESPEYAQMRANGVSELDAKKAIGASFARNAPELALPAAVGALSGKYGVEAMMAGVAPKMAASRLGAAGLGFAQEGGEGAVEQLATNIALKRAIPSQSLAHDVALNTVAEGLLGVPGGLVAGGPKSTPQGDSIRDTETIPETGTGTFAKALNTATEQRAQIADAGRSVTADEATVSAKARIDELGKKEAGTPDEELPGPNGEPVTVSGTPPQILSAGETQEKQFLEANKDNPAVLAGAKGKVVSPIPGAIDADVALERMRDQLRTDEAIVKAREREADAAHAATLQPQPEPESDAAPAPEPTDILSPSGGPWKAKLAAQKALKSRPDKADLALASVAGGYVLRRKPDAQQPDVHESPPVAAVADAGGSDQPAGSGGPVGPVAVDATGGSAPAAAAPAPSSGEAELLADGGAAPDGAVSIAGEPIDAEWRAFTPESGTKGVPRAEMPQIKAEHRGALTQFMLGRGIEHTQAEVNAADLKPTQQEFSPAKVDKAREFVGEDRAILVSNDGYVLDGHHQWLAKRDEGLPIRVIAFNAPIDQLVDEAKQFPSAEQAEGATDAQAVRSDEGQVRSGEPSQGATAEGSLRPSAEQGSGDLQQPAPDQAGEHGRQEEVAPGTRVRAKEGGSPGVVERILDKTNAMVRWDGGALTAWPTSQLEAAPTEATRSSEQQEPASGSAEDAGTTAPAGSPESAKPQTRTEKARAARAAKLAAEQAAKEAAAEAAKPTPEQTARRTEMVELRKRLSVLEQLRKCL